MTPTIVVGAIGLVFAILTYFAGKQKSSNEDREQRGRFEGEIKATLDQLKERFDRLEKKLDMTKDGFYGEIKEQIAEHERRYHCE